MMKFRAMDWLGTNAAAEGGGAVGAGGIGSGIGGGGGGGIGVTCPGEVELLLAVLEPAAALSFAVAEASTAATKAVTTESGVAAGEVVRPVMRRASTAAPAGVDRTAASAASIEL